MVRSWQRELSRAIQQAVDAGDLPDDLDVQELVFQLYGVILVLHHDGRLLDSPDAVGRARRSFDRLVDSYQRTMRLSRPKKRTNVRSVKT